MISGLGEANVYLYEFSARPAISKKPDYIIADHGDDLFFSFGVSSLNSFLDAKVTQDPTEEMTNVENMMVQYISSFVYTGYVLKCPRS